MKQVFGVVATVALLLSLGCGQTSMTATSTGRPSASSAAALSLPAPASCPAIPDAGTTPVAEAAAPRGLVTATINLPNSGLASLLDAYGSIWTVGHRDLTLYRISPADNRILAHIELPLNDQQSGVGAETAGPHGLWTQVNGDDLAFRIDPGSNSIVQTVRSPDKDMDSFLDTPDGLWLTTDFPGRETIYLVDPGTGVVIRRGRIPPGGDLGRAVGHVLAYGLGSLWLQDEADAVLYRIDPATAAITAVIRLPARPAVGSSLIVGSAGVYVTLLGGVLARVDASTNCVAATQFYAVPSPKYADPHLWSLVPGPTKDGLYVAFDQGAIAVADPITLRPRTAYRVDLQAFVLQPLVAYGTIWYSTWEGEGLPGLVRLRAFS